jgi:hypothetical protein
MIFLTWLQNIYQLNFLWIVLGGSVNATIHGCTTDKLHTTESLLMVQGIVTLSWQSRPGISQ